MMAREVFHVVPQDDGKWRVEPEGDGRTGRVFDDKPEAVRHATEQARSAPLGQIIVHCGDGRIQFEHTYGADPRQRPG